MAANAPDFFITGFARFRQALREVLFRHGVMTNPGSHDDEIVEGFKGLLDRPQTEIEEDHLIFITEMIVVNYATFEFVTPHPDVAMMCAARTAEMMEETLRKLLRKSLQQPAFRAKFDEHFSRHPMQEIREDGWEWLSRVLVWES